MEKPWGIQERKPFEWLDNATFYKEVYVGDVAPKWVEKGRKWFWTYQNTAFK